jgi:hypothetical protein
MALGQLFLCHQIEHNCFYAAKIIPAPKMIREFSPFWIAPLTEFETCLHHSLKEDYSDGCGASIASPTLCRRMNQNCLVKMHLTSR